MLKAIRLLVRLVRRITRIFAKFRKIVLVFHALIHGGKVIFFGKCRFEHKVVFQGEGKLLIGRGVLFGYTLASSTCNPILMQPRETDSKIYIGDGSMIMNGSEFIARTSIQIGQKCLIGPRTYIYDADFHGIKPDCRHQPGVTVPIIIGDNVWIGADVTILKGVSIGDDAVVAARSVVVKDVPKGAIVAGNPARIVGTVYE